MESILVSALVIFLSICGSETVKPEKFIVEVGRYAIPNFETNQNICFGTVIALSHVLTTADCVTLVDEEIQTYGITVTEELQGYTSEFFKRKLPWGHQ